MLLAWVSPHFQILPPLPASELGLSGADSCVGGFMYFLGLCGSLQWTPLQAWEFLPLLQPPHRFLQPEVLRLQFPALEPWVAWSVLLPSCSCWFICMQMWDCLVCQSASCCLAAHPRCPGCLSQPLLPVWMNVSFLFLKEDFIYLLLERGREGVREGNISVWLPLMRHSLGTWPTTQSCALDWESDQ